MNCFQVVGEFSGYTMRFFSFMRVRSKRELCISNNKEGAMDSGAINYQLFLSGDKNGLVEIIKLYKDGLILYLNSLVKDISLAEDLAEDTFVRLGTKKPKDKQKSSFKTWLYTIGRNIAIDYLRKVRRISAVNPEELSMLPSSDEEIEAAYIRDEQKRFLHRVMLNLKPDYRQVLWLIYFEELSCKEAGAVMKKTAHAVENLVYRARLKLKEELEKEGFVYEGL